MDPELEKAQVSQTDDTLKSTNGINGAEIDLNDHQKLGEDDTSNLRLDKHGLPLVPQPTQHKDDPLVSLALTSKHSIKALKSIELVPCSQVVHRSSNQLASMHGPHELSSHQPSLRPARKSIQNHNRSSILRAHSLHHLRRCWSTADLTSCKCLRSSPNLSFRESSGRCDEYHCRALYNVEWNPCYQSFQWYWCRIYRCYWWGYDL
jgi:hypothetical protein